MRIKIQCSSKIPWNKFKPRGAPAEKTESRKLAVHSLEHNPRLSELTRRMEMVATKNAAMEQKVEAVDKKVATMSTSMEDKFQQVLMGIAQLTEKVEDGHKAKHPRLPDAQGHSLGMRCERHPREFSLITLICLLLLRPRSDGAVAEEEILLPGALRWVVASL